MSYDDNFPIQLNNNENDEIEIENVAYDNLRGNTRGIDDFFNDNHPAVPYDPVDWNSPMTNMAATSENVDEVEERAILARKQDEEQRRNKIRQLQVDEIRNKQEFRDKAREYLENFHEKRRKTLEKRQVFNKQNEEELLQNRQRIREGKKNPWEKVCENIDIKESEYKGSKDVSRMRSVILVRKSDMMQMY